MEKKGFQIQIDEEILLSMLAIAHNFDCKTSFDDIKIESLKVVYNNRIFEIEYKEKVNHTVVTFVDKFAIIYEDGYITIEKIEE